ncbi:sugar ABC transporter ATP-binding protein [Rhodococcus sp. NPDC057529]|uniref:sugar ABC transporter ATP-binding protein n=1 Tax=Rhodococcus sp. NPDC057529 TaxID=3346158 RepID=UPI00366D753A
MSTTENILAPIGSNRSVVGPRIAIEHLSKTFGNRTVLNDVGFEIPSGQVIALLGQNGCGKSTLIKVLTGFHTPDSGKDAAVVVGDRRLPFPLHSGSEFKVATVHQDLALLPAASVTENMLIDQLGSGPVVPVRWAALHRRSAEMLARCGVRDIDPRTTVENLSPIQQAMVAIARAIAEIHDGGLLILDEVTAFLTQDGVDTLFEIIREVTAKGIAVLFVSHRMEEIWSICDRAVVLRNGGLVADTLISETTEEELISHVVGEPLEWLYPEKHPATDDVTLRVSCSSEGQLREFNLEAKAGEIVGLTGLRGMGYDRVVYALYGEEPGVTGSLEVGRRSVQLGKLDARRAMELGIRLVPSERLKNGAVGSSPVRENASLPVLTRFLRFGFLSRRREVSWTKDLIDSYSVSPADPHAIYSSLSGGNQQKVLVGRWLQTDPVILLLDEPTQGVDIGARRDIFSRIVEAAQGGVTVLYSTTEAQDLAELCHRVIVFRDGQVAGQVEGTEVTEDNIARLSWATSETNGLHKAG